MANQSTTSKPHATFFLRDIFVVTTAVALVSISWYYIGWIGVCVAPLWISLTVALVSHRRGWAFAWVFINCFTITFVVTILLLLILPALNPGTGID